MDVNRDYNIGWIGHDGLGNNGKLFRIQNLQTFFDRNLSVICFYEKFDS